MSENSGRAMTQVALLTPGILLLVNPEQDAALTGS